MDTGVAGADDRSSRTPSTHLARSAGRAGVATLTSRILGVARETVLARVFGAGYDMDALNVAFRIPNLARDLFAEGVLSAAFVPTFQRHLSANGKASAWRLANNVITTVLLVTSVLTVLGIVFAKPIVTAYGGRFEAVPGKLELTVWLAQVMLPFLPLVALAAVMMGMLNSLNHYFVPSLSPAAFNVASIVCALALVPIMPALGLPRIMAIAFAVVLGGVGQIAIQWLSLRGEGFRIRPWIDVRDPELQRMLVLMGPGVVGLAATQINLLVTTNLAAGVPGAVSWLYFAFRLMYLPVGLFGVSIATAVLPQVSRHATAADRTAVRATVAHGLALMLTVNIPAMVGLLVLATPIVRLILEHGQFGPQDTIATAGALQFYAIGLIGYSVVRIVSPVFYALDRSRTPIMVSAIAIGLNVVCALILVRVLGFRGLALATSIAALANASLLVLLLRRDLDRIDGRRLLATFWRISVAAVLMGVVSGMVEWLVLSAFASANTMAQTTALALAILSGLGALALCARFLSLPEFDETLAIVREQIRKSFGGTTGQSAA